MPLAETFKILCGIMTDLTRSEDVVSTGEIVARYGISRRSVPKYISILEEAGIPIYDERKRYYLAVSYRIPFTLTIEESEALYLALEWMAIQPTVQWRIVRTLLEKLGGKMHPDLADELFSPSVVSR